MKQLHGFLFSGNGRYFFMKNLMTRKLVFGVLVACVLALSVQGVAEAATFGTSRSGDLDTVLIDQEFKITFNVKLNSSISVASGIKVATQSLITTVVDSGGNSNTTDDGYVDADFAGPTDSNPTTHYRTYTDTSTDPDTKRRVWYTEDGAYYYNNEKVTIAFTGAAEIKQVGSHKVTHTAGESYVLEELGTDGKKLTSGNITLTLIADDARSVQLSIDDTTDDEDIRPGDTKDDPPPEIFTVYVVSGTSSEALALVSGGTGFSIGNDFGPSQVDNLFAVEDNVPLTYQVEGSGRVFVRESSTRRTT